MMQQGIHRQQQQQLASLLAAALPKDDHPPPSTTSTTILTKATSKTASPLDSKSVEEGSDSARVSAINSLHRAIVYPPNSLLVAHSAPFLAPGISQLLSDKSSSVRQSAAVAYGALSAVVCSLPAGSSGGRLNHVMLNSLVDHFINWALPLLNNVSAGDKNIEVALEGLREFINIGDVNGIERYASLILKTCKELLEDERTSFSLLHLLLSILSLISLKFPRFFHPYFLDIVDLLLGWALVPDLAESDREVIMGSFLQFQKQWVTHLQFSLGLLSKFMGDMEALLQDGSHGTPKQFGRLLALLSCFSTVLRSTASGLLEINLLHQISEPLSKMLPHLLGCLSKVGQKFGWSKWIEDMWKCLTLLAEILCERFATFYPLAIDILFQSLELDSVKQPVGTEKINSFQVHGVLKTNLQLLSLQKFGLDPSSVCKVLRFKASISRLRLHPNHLVSGSSAATYLFLLQHGNKEVVEQAITLILEELELLKAMLGGKMSYEHDVKSVVDYKSYSKLELFALINFDLKVLQSCVVLVGTSSLVDQPGIATLYLKRSEKLTSFIMEKLNPFDSPICGCLEMQVNVIDTLKRLAAIEFLCQCSIRSQSGNKNKVDIASGKMLSGDNFKDQFSALVVEHISKYSLLLVEALNVSSPLAVKVVSLEWVKKFCEDLRVTYDNLNTDIHFYEAFAYACTVRNVVCSVLDAAFDMEPKVRAQAALALELILQVRLIHPSFFNPIAEVVLEKLSDPDTAVKMAFVKLFSNVLPATMYSCGLRNQAAPISCGPGILVLCNTSNLYWKQVFALKQLCHQFNSQQLVTVLSYISQRWKAPLSSWIQRLVHTCQISKEHIPAQVEELQDFDAHNMWLDIKVEENIVERICLVSNLAGAWWAVHEAARYCIVTRLRTNLGGPTQTFAALEQMLLDVAHVLQLDSEQIDGSLNILGSSGAHLLPMRLLLDFVEALKKNVYNAYEGSAVLPSTPRQSSVFFRANKKVCVEWFSRMCEPMMNAGLALQCHDATIQYCTLRVEELRNLHASALKDRSKTQISESYHHTKGRLSKDLLKTLRYMSLALCRTNEAEALIGLQKWVSMTFSSLFEDENESLKFSGLSGPLTWITGLVYQAEGKYEKAAAYFAHLLQKEDSLSSMGSDGVQFAIGRIIESYTAVSDWKSLESWLLELQTLRGKHAGKKFSGALTTAGNEITAIQALARFDEGDLQGSWTCLDLTPKTSGELTLDPRLALQRSEQMLLQALLLQSEGKLEKVPHCLQKAKSMLDETLSVLSLDGLSEAASHVVQLHCIYAFEESHELRRGENELKTGQSLLSSCIQSLQTPMNVYNQDCSPWLKILRVYRTIFPNSSSTLKLCVDISRLARKQGNFLLAKRLNNYLSDRVYSCSEERHRDLIISNMQYENILLMHAEKKFEGAFASIWSFVRSLMVSSAPVALNAGDSILKAKACLKLSDWLRQDYPDMIMEDVVYNMLVDFNIANIPSADNRIVSLSNENLSSKPSSESVLEEMIGTATKVSTQLCSAMGKSWISYASWCYRQATMSLSNTHEAVPRSCFFSPVLVQELTPERFTLTEDEIKNVECLIMQLFQNSDESQTLDEKAEEESILNDSTNYLQMKASWEAIRKHTVNILEAAAGAPGGENSTSLSAAVASQLLNCLRSACVDKEERISTVVSKLIEIWWSLRKRRVSIFGHAAFGFTQYLMYASTKLCKGLLSGTNCESPNQNTGSNTLRATLYVLHILLNYGVELKDTLEHALSTVPLLPWQEVTPQLFARLSSHPEQAVRKQLEGLLMMLAKQSPWSIVYPTLVDVNASDEQPSEELQHILGCLRDLYPRLVQDVQLMINELGNVTVLWEELWLSTLQDLHMDVVRRINMLKEEAARIAENVTLSHSEKNKISAAKYSAMMAPIIIALERRLASTSRKPETPHEFWFHQEYREQLKSAITALKTPPASAAALGDVWRPFDSIAASLASYQRKATICLGEVAPHLALLSSSDVPMPGLEKQVSFSETEGGLTRSLQGIVTISSFLDQVTILSTKTRPKKLVILGSDGKKYTYLLKGREDLRLDARIMQLLQAINSFLYSSPTTQSDALGIRYYSVTPISGRAGLIQWVDNVISIYSTFKSWQNRVQLAQLSVSGAATAENSSPPPVPRPSDMFYGKIIPALKEKGIRRVISRRDWPHEVKRKVLLDLMKEVPNQLLHQELWCASEGFKAFSSKLKRYSGSVAAMSMVGHILGLGDRHLDNILMDFCTGDIVHIDYNVCFDKGRKLKVPEIVPFRLTQTMEFALGLTGVEGTFRASCEAVLGVLRKNKDLLLMLLEVFVWDPLIEWTRGDFHDEAAIGGEERKGMELAVSLSLFASRMQEIRVPLQEHHDQLLATLPAVESALERFAEILNQYELTSTAYIRADQERSNLIMREKSAKSIVAEATCNLDKIRVSYEIQGQEFASANAMVVEKAQETSTWIEQRGKALDALRRNLIPEINASLNLSGTADSLSLTSAVLVAGVPLTVVPEPTLVHCQDIDREVSQSITDLGSGLSSAFSALEAYSLALQRILPLNYLTTSSVHGWAEVLQLSANAHSSDILSLARRQAAELIAKVQGDDIDSVKHSYGDLCFRLQKYAVEVRKVEEEYNELVHSIGSEAESKAKDRLFSSLTKYIRSPSLLRRKGDDNSSKKTEQPYYNTKMDAKPPEQQEEKKDKVAAVLHIAVSSMYDQVKQKVYDSINNTAEGNDGNNRLQSDVSSILSMFEEQVEKCVLLGGFISKLQYFIEGNTFSFDTGEDFSNYHTEENWASLFQNSVLSCKKLVGQMTDAVLPDVMRSAVSFSSEVMDAFGLISQIRGSIDMALEHLMEVKLEQASLVELEQNYFVKVGLITERQLALEVASMKDRDNLSWEEAEELASQEEACRAQLDQLHQTWNQRDSRISSLKRRESEIKSELVSSEHHIQSLINSEQFAEPQDLRSKALLAILFNPFSDLESIDNELSSLTSSVSPDTEKIPDLVDVMSSGHSLSEHIWSFGSLLKRHSFFVWKIGVVDSFLDACIHDAASSMDQNLGFDQLLNVVKKKLEFQLQEHIGRYLKERVTPALISVLGYQSEHLKQLKSATEELLLEKGKNDYSPVKRVQLMLEEFCSAHETVRAAKSAATLMKRQADELKEALRKSSLEIVQMEWIHDTILTPSHNTRLVFQEIFASDKDLHPILLNLSRRKLLETIQSAISKIAQSMGDLQACEQTSMKAEGQLERAMEWACGGSNSSATAKSSAKASGIPLEFDDHLLRRRQTLWECREKASKIVKFCMSILEFEASRNGILHIQEENHALKTSMDGRTWQQVFFNALARLEVTCHSFKRTEQELKLAQTNMEVASSDLYSTTNKLHLASLEAKSASGDLQNTVISIRDCAYEASVALSAFTRISKGHTALTSETGSMLEEVLAITEDMHDVHSLGKEAAAAHLSLTEELPKANAIILPLESMLSSDVAAMTEALGRDGETKMEVSAFHGQAIYQSYCSRVGEAYQNIKPLVPSILTSVKGLHSMMSRLARTASLCAGNLNKALEGLGESQDIKSQEINFSKLDLSVDGTVLDDKEEEIFAASDGGSSRENFSTAGIPSEDKGWLSPPDSIYSGSSQSSITSAEACLPPNFDNLAEVVDEVPFNHKEAAEFFDPISSSQSDSNTIIHSGYQNIMPDFLESTETPKDVLQSHVEAGSPLADSPPPSSGKKLEVRSGGKDEACLLNKDKTEVGYQEVPQTQTNNRISRGKNTYAMSVLRRIEMKLDGRDVAEKREISITEQVDYLLKQATSVDNLCNMYEGWTPWI